ncbi:MAG: hypothetical protein JNK33_02715 [Candidatus Doudnabacteria bacterium]|nr:hypothetical protein [Candidatus Doudnabacteria bacterium]
MPALIDFDGSNLGTLTMPGGLKEQTHCPNARALAQWMMGASRAAASLAANGDLASAPTFRCAGCFAGYVRTPSLGHEVVALCSADPQPPRSITQGLAANDPNASEIPPKIEPYGADGIVPGLRLTVPLHEVRSPSTMASKDVSAA